MSGQAPSDPAVDLTVAVVNWNGAQWLRGCLESLRRVQGVRLEVIVVDNASTDESARIVREEFGEVKLIANSENLGFARGNNQALRMGRGRYALLLNNDAALLEGSAESLVRFLDAHPQAGLAAGRLENPEGSLQSEYYHLILPTLASLTADLFWLKRFFPSAHVGRGRMGREWDAAKPSRLEQLPGACMVVRREVLERVGFLDESYNFWYEDVDFCHRALKAGWELWYVPEARILHHGGGSSGLLDASTRTLWRFRNMLRYARKYFSPARLVALRFIVAGVLLMRLPLAFAASVWPSARTRKVWQGAWKAYLTLLGEVVRLPDLDVPAPRSGA